MGLKERVMELMRHADSAGLERLVSQNRRAVRHLLGRLWDTDSSRRMLAARALGVAAEVHPDLAADVVRRLIWGLNDESATNGVYGIPALGEIGNRAPSLFEPFIGPMTSFLWDDGLRLEILRALTRIAEANPALVESVREALEPYRNTKNREERRLVAALLN
jgi:hypothetical protein